MQPPTQHPARTAAALLALFLALLSLVAAHWGPLISTDRDIAVTLHRSALAHDGWTRTSRVLTDWVWDPLTMRALLAVVAGWLLWRREWLLTAWIVGTAIVGAALQQGVKAAVDRPRPHWAHPVDTAHYAAFPSGHALTATLACGLVLWVMTLHGAATKWLRLAAAVAVVSVLGVGFTRLYLGVHWAGDVLGGWLLGAALVYAAIAGYAYASRPKDERAGAPDGDGRARS
ncbi:phosphatase PAP2 family protein [Streptomyces sp. NPDC005271]|uniref:phosphatase PAP2 family protein n=1 Tax=unclassified Streptomyces TaxID=2593676 RepID=UPI0033BB753D